MKTLEEVIEGVRSNDARLFCEQDGKVWQVVFKGNGSAVRLEYLGMPARDLGSLTAREREMIDLVIQGYTYRYISQHLYISEGTVKKTLHNAYAKLRVSSRIELINNIRII